MPPAPGRNALRSVLLVATLLSPGACADRGGRDLPVANAEDATVRLTTISTPDVQFDVMLAEVGADFFAPAPGPAGLGRTFTGDDFSPGARPVALLGHDVWQRLRGDPSIIGTDVYVDGVAHTVVGIAPEGFAIPEGATVWAPRQAQRER